MYEKIQFIGYDLYTGPDFISDSQKVYRGIESEFDDLASRLNWLTQVVDTVQKALPGKDSSILRVFMIPEFLMRGTEGAYSMATAALAIEALQALAGDARFSDWLFVFGTVVGRSFPMIDRGDGRGLRPDPRGRVETYNLCPVISGGWDAEGTNDPVLRQAATRVVMKEELSGIDFINTTENPLVWARVGYLAPARASGPGREQQRRGDDGGCIFTVGGITFGLEVCLDHRECRLKNSPPAPGQPLVQIQLVPSCGMRTRPDAVVAVTHGWVFNVDGYLRRHCLLNQVTKEYSLRGPAELGKDVPLREIPLPPLPDNFTNVYDPGSPGQVLYSEPVAIPAARTA